MGEFVTIVSGLPRSGTSMMMQAIDAGGMEAMTDKVREADEDNPKGYYEYEVVKQTKNNASWLKNAGGKVVKMIYRLLYDLPEGHEYRVVFMERDIAEVLASQKKMLERLGKDGGGISDEQMASIFSKQLEQFDAWVAEKPHFSLIKVGYSNMIADPEGTCNKVNKFLGGGLDVAKMASVVDSKLYRNRK